MSLYRKPQQAGQLERAWNSTIGLPQQLLWRVLRAAKDPNIDLFSEKGLLDFANIPLLGMLDDHKEDVMPDYMAEYFGGRGVAAEIAASVLTDPLFYMTGGLSSVGKAAKGAVRLGRTAAVSETIEQAAKAKGVLTKDFMSALTNDEFLELARKARTGNRNMRVSKKDMNALRDFELGISEGGIKGGDLFADTLHKTAHRKLAYGLPGLSRLGLKIDIPTQHQSWWSATRSATRQGSDMLGVSAVTRMAFDGMSKVPLVGTALRGTNEIVTQARGGWRVGEETRAVIQHATRAMTDGEDARLLAWTDRLNGAGDLVPKLANHKTENVIAQFDKFLAKGLTTEEAFDATLRKFAGNAVSDDSTQQIWSRLVGSGAKDPVKFGLSKDPGIAKQQLAQRLDEAQTYYDSAARLLRSGEITTSLKQNELGQIVTEMNRRREELRTSGTYFSEFFAGLSDKAFTTGQRAKALLNQGFRTGTQSSFNAEGVRKLVEESAAGSDRINKLGKALYTGLREALSEMPGAQAEDVEKLLYHMMTGRPLTEELVTSTSLARINPTNADEVLKGFETFLTRHHGSMRAIEGLLDSSSLPEAVRNRIAMNFEREIGGMIPALDGQQLTATFDRVSEIIRGRPVPRFDRFDEMVMRRPHNAHTLQQGDTAGRFIGELSDADIQNELLALEAKAQRPYTPQDIANWIEETPDVASFKSRYGLTDAEVISVMGRRGPATNRIVRSDDLIERPLWDEARAWTGPEARAELDLYKLQLEMTENGYRVKNYAGLSDRQMRRLGLSQKKEYGSLSEAMQAVRKMLADSPSYRTKYGPDLVKSARRIEIPASEIDTVNRAIGKEGQAILAGEATRFDESLLVGYNNGVVTGSFEAAEDYKQLRAAQQSRAESATGKFKRGDAAFDGQVRPRYEQQPGEVTAPLRVSREDISNELIKGVDAEDVAGVARKPSEYALAYAQARMSVNEARAYMQRQREAGVLAPVIPHELLDDIHSAMSDMSTIFDDVAVDALPRQARNLLNAMRGVQTELFDASRRSGVFGPGAPIGYLGRLFTKTGRERIARIIGQMDSTDTEVATRLGMRNSSRFKRTTDSLTVEDLDELHATLRRASASGDPQTKKWFDEMEAIMEEEGYFVRGERVMYSDQRLSGDPIAALLTRLSQAQQEGSIEKYFDTFLKASGKADGESLALGGTVVGILDNQKNPITSEFLRSAARRRTDKKAGTTKLSVQELTMTEDVVPTYLKLRTDDGAEHIVSLGIEESGFGFLPLGQLADETVAGVKPTSAKAFVRASTKADLDQSFVEASNLTSRGALDSLVGQQVVYGNQHTITAAAKAVSDTVQVAPQALRTFDTINYGIKLFQTAFRVPFQAFNLASGVFQARMAGVSPKNLAAGYVDTMQMLWGDTTFIKAGDQILQQMDVPTLTHGGVTLLPHNDVVDAIRRMGGSLPNNIDPEVLRASRLGEIPNATINLGDGGSVSMFEFMQAAAEGNLFGTFATSISRGSRTVSDSLIGLRMSALMEGGRGKVGGFFDGLIEKLGGTAGELRETGEVINRMSTALGLVREGHPLARAIEMAKNAHVPYERLTPFERNKIRRAISYYTFPRHYLPWAYTKFAENPTELAQLASVIKNQRMVTMDEGKVHLKMGDYRVDLGRINANFEAALTLGSFADRLMIPAAEAVGIGDQSYPFSPRDMTRSLSDSGLTSLGGLFGLALGGGQFLADGQRSPFQTGSAWEDATQIVWPFKAAGYLARQAGIGGYTTKEEFTPFVDYTPMEKWITDSDFGLGVRKVRPYQESLRAVYEYRRMIQSMKLRFAATTDPRQQKLLRENIQALTQVATGLIGAGMQ